MASRSPNGEVIGQKVKGHGSKKRSFWGIFGFKKNSGHTVQSCLFGYVTLKYIQKNAGNKILNFLAILGENEQK